MNTNYEVDTYFTNELSEFFKEEESDMWGKPEPELTTEEQAYNAWVKWVKANP